MTASWIGKMFQLGHTRYRVPVLVHWSVPELCLFLLGTGVDHILTVAAAVAAYLAMLIIHELGHEVAARRLGYRVAVIKIYPIHGSCWFERPGSRSHEALIAWAGPVAQFVVAAPLALFVILTGPTRIEPVDAGLAILGFFSPVLALVNLLPLAPLDGHKAWALVPIMWRRMMQDRKQPEPQTAMEAMEQALKKASRRGGRSEQ